MDYGLISGAMTVVMLIAFLGIVAWALSAKRRAAFEAAARVPLEEDKPGGDSARRKPQNEGSRT